MAGLSLYLIGAPGAGKSAVFDALITTPEGAPFATKGPHRLGTVKVPDARLEKLRDLYQPKKYTPAEVAFVDVGLARGEGAEKIMSVRDFLGEASAFVLVIQAFGECDQAGKPVDPVAQLRTGIFDLIFSDLERVEKRLERIAQDKVRGLKPQPGEEELLLKFKPLLENETMLRGVPLREDEEATIRTHVFLTRKPILVVANVAEDRLDGHGLEALEKTAADLGLEMLRFCAPIETDIARMPAADQPAFLKDFGITEPARPRLIRTAYHALDLISFFTVGEDEVRAWTIRRGTHAQQAGGKIHTDIERGFIRAEVVASEPLIEAAGNMGKCRENATLRLEGKAYEVRDGEVLHFRFNV